MTKYVQRVEDIIDEKSERLHEIGRFLWENPEVRFEEEKAHDFLTGFLESEGFQLQRNYILPTAFRAEYGDGGPVAIIMCEYDALPDIGHACGHNLIAESSVAAAVAVKEVLRQESSTKGKVVLLGTPAEETGMGKHYLLRGGAFYGADFAMMAHPAHKSFASTPTSALAQLEVKFKGKASHAGASPWEGINALDAAVAAYVNMSVLRQQMKPNWRATGIIKNGGVRANIIPSLAIMEFILRAPHDNQLDELLKKANACFASAAAATGCSVTVTTTSTAKNLIPNKTMANIYKRFAEAFGTRFESSKDATLASGSTDAGDVSHAVPTIHPFFDLGSDASVHTVDFQQLAGTPGALEHSLRAGKTLALTCLEILTQDSVLQEIRDEFIASTGTAE